MVPTLDPSPGPKNENLAKKKNWGLGEFLIDAINAKKIIRTPQMGQNLHPKVHQKTAKKQEIGPPAVKGWADENFFSYRSPTVMIKVTIQMENQ